jgi:hypothetical protein
MIKHLVVDIEFFGKEYIPLIAHFVAPTITSLDIRAWVEEKDSSSACCEALGFLFKKCDGIPALRIRYFDFGNDPSILSDSSNVNGEHSYSQYSIPCIPIEWS